MTKAVVFDLDGTLADTAHLVTGNRRREPYHVLSKSPPGQRGQQVAWGDERETLPGELAAKGYRVGIITASPPAYASTLADLLNIDFERLLANSRNKAQSLGRLAVSWDIDPIEMYYVGDKHHDSNSDDMDAADEDAADEAGCEFIRAKNIGLLRQLRGITPGPPGRSTGPETNVPADSPSAIKCRRCGFEISLSLARRLTRINLGRCQICNLPFALPRDAGGADTTRILAPGILAPEIAAAAFRDLKEFPYREDRFEFQRRFLDNVPPKARDCVLVLNPREGLFQFPPWLVSKTELQANPNLRLLTIKAAARLFPVSQLPMGAVMVESLVPYWSKYGQLLAKLKDWSMHKGSGREVHQSLGYFIALALAGHLEPVVKRADRQILLVPMPSRPCTIEHPGELSLRLVTRIAHFLNVDLAPVLVHGHGHSDISMGADFERWQQTGLPVVVIDDQYTSGKSMQDALSLLGHHGFEIEAAITWSRSQGGNSNMDSSTCFLRSHLGPSWNSCLCPHNGTETS